MVHGVTGDYVFIGPTPYLRQIRMPWHLSGGTGMPDRDN
jgi:hypothetical protein